MTENQKFMVIAGAVVVLFVAVVVVLASGSLAPIFDPDPEASFQRFLTRD
ncbi:hypothetical protein ACFUCV_11680 [Specibacter sp. NPDC057265]